MIVFNSKEKIWEIEKYFQIDSWDLVSDHKWRLKLSLGMSGVEKRWESKPGLLVRNKIQMTSTDLVRSLGVDGFLKRKKKKNV